MAAIERAAEARRQRRSRRPLTLRHAKRHLGKVPPLKDTSTLGSTPPLHALAESLRGQAEHDPRGAALSDLAGAMEGLTGTPQAVVAAAMQLVTAFFIAAWDALDPEERQIRLDEALELLGLDGLTDATRLALAEECARDDLRRGYPTLTVATISSQVCG